MKRHIVLAILLAACGGETTTEATRPVAPATVPPAPVTPSPPAKPGPLTTSLIVSKPRLAGQVPSETVVYVSLPSGSIAPFEVSQVSNARTGQVVSPKTILGGFDPVPIQARVGDTIVVTLLNSSPTAAATRVVVTASRPVQVVRTSPGKDDSFVSANVVVAAVFSEPLDSASVSDDAIRLTRGTTEVLGTLSLDLSGTMLRFTPSQPLEFATSYQFVVAPALAASGGVTGFTTTPAGTSADVAKLVGEWQATSWRFSTAAGQLIDDPVIGWGSGYFYEVKLIISSSSPTTIKWRWEEAEHLGPNLSHSLVAGRATAGDGWFFGQTDETPWPDQTGECTVAYLCPMQGRFDVKRVGIVLVLTRHEPLWYPDDFGGAWLANEVVTFQLVTPGP